MNQHKPLTFPDDLIDKLKSVAEKMPDSDEKNTMLLAAANIGFLYSDIKYIDELRKTENSRLRDLLNNSYKKLDDVAAFMRDNLGGNFEE